MAYAEVKQYHGDDGIFSAEEYRQVCMDKGQSQSFSGIGAQHQYAWGQACYSNNNVHGLLLYGALLTALDWMTSL
jgi:hypothetical protein